MSQIRGAQFAREDSSGTTTAAAHVDAAPLHSVDKHRQRDLLCLDNPHGAARQLCHVAPLAARGVRAIIARALAVGAVEFLAEVLEHDLAPACELVLGVRYDLQQIVN